MPTSITIPMEAVALMDGEEKVMPTQGDAISVTVEGTVESISDGSVPVYATSANGVDLGEEAAPEMSERDEMLSMLEGAQL